MVGTSGADFHPQFDPGAVEAVFHKGQYSAAYSGFEGADDDGTPLADWLRSAASTQVDIVGIATDYCVQATAADAVAAGFATRVLLDLTAGVAPESTARPSRTCAPPASRSASEVHAGCPTTRRGLPAWKARTPSLASSCAMTARWISVSRRPTAARSRSNESHSSRLLAATDIGAVFVAMSCADFQGCRQHLVGVEHPAAQAELNGAVAVECRSGQDGFRRRVAIPTNRGSTQCEYASPTTPRRTWTTPYCASAAKNRMSHCSASVRPQPDRVAVDRGDHRWQRPGGHVDTGR